MDVRDDAGLLEAWRAGDTEAGQRLFQRHFRRLYLFFSNKTSSDVSDLVQRTMLACVERRDRIANASAFRAYLLSIARRQLIRSYRQSHALRDEEVMEMSVAALTASPSAALVRKRESRALLSALRSIPLDQQIVLELHYWEDLSMAQLAEVLDVPLGTAKSRLRRARERLTQRVSEIESLEPLHTTADNFDRWARSIREEFAVPQQSTR